jgi:hypothetical protein
MLPDWAINMEKRLSTMEKLLEENMNLKAELQEANTLIKQLKSQLDTKKNNQQPPAQPVFVFGKATSTQDSAHAPTNTTTTQSSTQQSYATIAKKNVEKKPGNNNQKNKNKKKALEKLRNPTEGMLDWAVRSLQASSGPQGYEFIYLATPKRTPASQTRKILTIFGINTKRIIDIHAPTRGVIGLLIHQSFKDELTAALEKKKINPITFDPHAATVIVDPRYSDYTADEKSEKATEIHHQRIGRICHNLKNKHLGNAIINFFHHTEGPNYIPTAILDAHFSPSTADPTDTQYSDFEIEECILRNTALESTDAALQ